MNVAAFVAVSAMAERLANHFACYRPASDLFLQLLDMDKLEDAKFMLAVSARFLRPASASDSTSERDQQNALPVCSLDAPARLSPGHVTRLVLRFRFPSHPGWIRRGGDPGSETLSAACSLLSVSTLDQFWIFWTVWLRGFSSF